MKPYLLIPLLLTAPAWAQNGAPAAAPTSPWQNQGAAQYVCGGVSDEGMHAIKSLRSEAGSELLFTSGPEGAYIADVAVTVQGGKLKEMLSFTANGPVCLLKLPKGNYIVDASYRGKTVRQSIKVDGPAQQTRFSWPAF